MWREGEGEGEGGGGGSLQHFSENVFALISLVFTVCSNKYKPTDFCAEFYLPCIPISRISSNCQ